MQCKIHWNTLELAQWERLFGELPASNLLQSYDYARAICPLQRQRARWGLIEIDGVRAGLIQVLEASALAGLLHVQAIDRGPLWFDGFGSEKNFEVFLQAYRKEFPKRWGRKSRIIPEIPHSDSVLQMLQNHKLNQNTDHQYETIAIDLNQELESLKANLRKNWRNMLNRAERENVQIEWHQDGKAYAELIQLYQLDKLEKAYEGASVKTMNALAKTFLPKSNLWCGFATKDGKKAGSVLLLLHGSGATYQIGWTSAVGRKIGAQHLLLWDSVQRLKNHGIKHFDLGGINDEDAKGVKRFKEGLGGRYIRLPGLFS